MRRFNGGGSPLGLRGAGFFSARQRLRVPGTGSPGRARCVPAGSARFPPYPDDPLSPGAFIPLGGSRGGGFHSCLCWDPLVLPAGSLCAGKAAATGFQTRLFISVPGVTTLHSGKKRPRWIRAVVLGAKTVAGAERADQGQGCSWSPARPVLLRCAAAFSVHRAGFVGFLRDFLV